MCAQPRERRGTSRSDHYSPKTRSISPSVRAASTAVTATTSASDPEAETRPPSLPVALGPGRPPGAVEPAWPLHGLRIERGSSSAGVIGGVDLGAT